MNAWLWFIMLVNGLTLMGVRRVSFTAFLFFLEFAGAATFLFLPALR